MITGYAADLHVDNHRQFGGKMVAGVNDRCREILRAYGSALAKAAFNHATAFVVLGDIFHTSRPSPQVVAQVGYTADASHMQHHFLVGNHDAVSGEPGDHALGPLDLLVDATVWEEPGVSSDDFPLPHFMVPFSPFPTEQRLPALLSEMKVDLGGRGILCMHAGIRDANTPWYLKDAPNSIDVQLLHHLCLRHGIRTVMAGDWHKHRFWDFDDGVQICQLGTLTPASFSDCGFTDLGHMATINEDGVLEFFNVPGPRFVLLSKLADLDQLDSARRRYAFVRLSVPPDEVARAQEALSVAGLAGYEVVALEDAERAAQVAEAVKRVKAAKSMDEAIAVYLEANPPPASVDAIAVLAKVREYLQAGEP